MLGERKHIRLLIVNEEEAYCNLVKEHIKLNDYCYDIECQCVPSGEAAVKAISNWGPNMVLLDMFISDMNGFDLLKYCNGTQTPVVVTSEEHLDQIEREVLEVGAADYFKADDDPDNMDYLLEKVVELATSDQTPFWYQ
ncbi:MAG: response regulator [Bdellovibrionota bacterium]|jgi:DNA-binding response OmpR family regulator